MNNVNYRQLHAKADINNGRRAFSDAHNHVVVRLNGVEHGFDLACAIRLQEDLSCAIRNTVLFDAHNHIVVRLNGVEHGFDLACAIRLQEDLSRAIRNAALSDDQYLTLSSDLTV